MSFPPPRVGDRIGSWLLERELGSGGHGTLFVGNDGLRRVALKLVEAETVERQRRVEREIFALKQVSHEGLVELYEWGAHSRGMMYLAMELIDGEDLATWCATVLARRLRDEVDVSSVVRLFRPIVGAVATLHRAELLHRDLTPANIVRRTDGRGCLVDLGVAKDGRLPTLTPVDLVPGTLQYMAPELFDGQPSGPASDVYAVGLVIFEILTGEQRTIPQRVRAATGLDPGEAWGSLRELVRSATHPVPADRLTADSLLAGIESSISSRLGPTDPTEIVGGHRPGPDDPTRIRSARAPALGQSDPNETRGGRRLGPTDPTEIRSGPTPARPADTTEVHSGRDTGPVFAAEIPSTGVLQTLAPTEILGRRVGPNDLTETRSSAPGQPRLGPTDPTEILGGRRVGPSDPTEPLSRSTESHVHPAEADPADAAPSLQPPEPVEQSLAGRSTGPVTDTSAPRTDDRASAIVGTLGNSLRVQGAIFLVLLILLLTSLCATAALVVLL